MTFIEWQIDREAGEIVGPCGCRVPNTFDGMMQARAHEHVAEQQGDNK